MPNNEITEKPTKEDNKVKAALAYDEILAPIEYTVDGQKIKLTPKIVQEYLVSGDNEISLQEFKFYVELLKARGLNPFLKEAYIIKYSKTAPAQIVVGKDAIMKRAVLHPQFDGRKQGIIVMNKNEEIEKRVGTFKLNDEQLVGGWAIVFRKDWKYPVEITVGFSEVAQSKSSGELNNQWATKGATMVEKVALVRALREAFVEDIAGMYDADEVWDNFKDTPPPHIIIEQDEPIGESKEVKEEAPKEKAKSINDI